ncbi:uncharacterized protein LOC129310563 [Prosopis cineraria]|uniref:uncharacterized protein LOC129310563 n=1 Tax=Prosopis cineraria TaxID=364024 RepID=UPI00240F88B4|nr:uncharacterized protein LOC129310563 [Prosopis cineraria]
MAALVPTLFPLSAGSPLRFYHLRKPKPSLLLISCSRKALFRSSGTIVFSGGRNLIPLSMAATVNDEYQAYSVKPLNLPLTFVRLAVSVVLFIGFGFCIGIRVSSASPPTLPASSSSLQDNQATEDEHEGREQDNNTEDILDKDLEAAFNAWKSKTYALTVPLRIVALRGSVPPSWIKDFIKSQGRRLKFNVKYNTSLESIFSNLSIPFTKGNIGPASALAADIVGIGDSWLKFAINKAIIEPIRDVDDQDWFKGLDERWKVYLRRNSEGEIDPNGDIWAAPYRWGCMVIAYKKNKFRKHNLAPIEDWADLWRSELAGRISMVDSPREVIGAVLKYMGASYNTNDINLQVNGGRDAVKHNLALLGKQVRLFDSVHYLKAFGVGDVWVTVGWSSDIIPIAKRMSNVTVVVPKSGASLWADLWAIPAASRIQTNRIGGRIRGPSPLIHQWIEFCLQAARALPFKQEVVPGASPNALHVPSANVPTELTKGKPRLDTNLIAGAPPPEILDRCEFLEPLFDSTISDYRWLLATIQEPNRGLVHKAREFISSMTKFPGKSDPKLA